MNTVVVVLMNDEVFNLQSLRLLLLIFSLPLYIQHQGVAVARGPWCGRLVMQVGSKRVAVGDRGSRLPRGHLEAHPALDETL